MKKLMIAAILLIATSGVTVAQTTGPGNGTPRTNKNTAGFVDANKNGICDTYENRGTPLRNTAQARRSNKGQGAGLGRGRGQCGAGSAQGRRAGSRGCRRF